MRLRRFTAIVFPVVFVACLALTGCAGISVRTEPFLGGPNYAPTDPERVAIIAGGVVERPYDPVGKVYVDVDAYGTASRELIEKKIRYAVADMGGDAGVIIYDKNRVFPVVYLDYWGNTVAQEMRRGIVALAIKYK